MGVPRVFVVGGTRTIQQPTEVGDSVRYDMEGWIELNGKGWDGGMGTRLEFGHGFRTLGSSQEDVVLFSLGLVLVLVVG